MRTRRRAAWSLYGSWMAMIWRLAVLGFVIMFFNALPAIIMGLLKIAVWLIVGGIVIAMFAHVIYGKDETSKKD